MTTTTSQENTMNATTTYASQNKGTQAGTDAFAVALERVQQIARLNQALQFDLRLLDYLAARVETHNLESRLEMADTIRPVVAQADLQDTMLRMSTIETEAARTFLVAAGIDVAKIAPVDYPTLTRAYVAARSESGHTFAARLG
jgi:hypothetical protein